jgi:hypothetical protein
MQHLDVYKYFQVMLVQSIFLPCSNSDARIVDIIHIGNEGSIIAIPIFPNEIAPKLFQSSYLDKHDRFYIPAASRMYGSLIKVFNEAPSIGSLVTPGFNTVNCNTIDQRKHNNQWNIKRF